MKIKKWTHARPAFRKIVAHLLTIPKTRMDRAPSGEQGSERGVSRGFDLAHPADRGEQGSRLAHAVLTSLLAPRPAWIGRLQGSEQVSKRFGGTRLRVCPRVFLGVYLWA
jgi:hypothetical protein